LGAGRDNDDDGPNLDTRAGAAHCLAVRGGAGRTDVDVEADVGVRLDAHAQRNTAQQTRTFGKTNPPQSAGGATPRQMMAARLLLAGRRVAEVAAELGVHPYTVSRWKRDPLFEAELRRQVDRVDRIDRIDRATSRNTAQQNPTRAQPSARNEANWR
jgi:hypothetical protein